MTDAESTRTAEHSQYTSREEKETKTAWAYLSVIEAQVPLVALLLCIANELRSCLRRRHAVQQHRCVGLAAGLKQLP